MDDDALTDLFSRRSATPGRRDKVDFHPLVLERRDELHDVFAQAANDMGRVLP
jgi:hypothetical protein